VNKIISPLQHGMTGAAVVDLQTALHALLERGLLLATADGDRRELTELLLRERAQPFYGDATHRLVRVFQGEHRLEPIGDVDERTAAVLNALLRELGLLDGMDRTDNRPRVVSGRVTRSDQQPFSGTVRAFHITEGGSIALGETTADAQGNYTIRYEPLPQVTALHLRVSILNEAGGIAHSSDVIRNAGMLEMIDLVVPFVQTAAAARRVEGRIMFDTGVPAEGLTLRLYRLGFGGAQAAERLSETATREHGVYNLPYSGDGQPANIEVRAVNVSGEEVSLSKILKNAGEREVLNLVAPSNVRTMQAEFTRLAADLQPHVGELARLANARETDEQADLTLLHETTGWDARLIATAAVATRLSAPEETALPADALYGLFRAGLPSDKLQLARVTSEVFDHAVMKARSAGILDMTDEQVVALKQSFDNFSINTRLAVQAPGSRATYGDMLTKLNLAENDQQTFAKLYLNHRGDAQSLWTKAAEAGLVDAIPKLQKQGKLAFLTTNNPELTATLQNQLGAAGPEQLVKLGLYKKEKWLDLIDVVPPAFADAEDPKASYAEDMARRVRISYSTEVMWDMIETGDLEIQGANENFSAFLKNAIAKGFKLGQTPIDAFVRANFDDVFAGIPDADRNTTTEMVKTLQRVYQLTPSNDAMKALLNEGLVSAQDVLAYPLETFLERFAHLFPSEEEARLVYRKAEQVSNITYSLFSLAKELDSSPAVFAMSAPPAVREAAKENLKKHYPTMESLFGSLDFCECEQCRSVLSPAAYFVDLLQFLDREPAVWANTLKHWEKRHGTAPYPFKNTKAFNDFITRWRADHPGTPDPDTKRTPYEVLIERRPDLPHIQLTCENTNTALPQIDLVNEILEYYVAHNALKADTARDTGTASSAELLAEPQNVIREAYDRVRDARYPIHLPFDLWIETVRQFCNYFETPLEHVLDAFRPGDKLFAPTEPFDLSSVFLESLGISPAEAAIFTDPDPIPKWHALYGFESAATATTEATDSATGQRIDINSAKALSRRLGVTYKEITEIVQTQFVNPRLADVGILHKLGMTIQDARLYTKHGDFYEQNKDLIGKDRETLSAEDQQRYDELSKRVAPATMTGWEILNEIAEIERRLTEMAGAFNKPFDELRTHVRNIAFDKILVLADEDPGCNFDKTTLRYAEETKKADAIAFLRINLFVRLWRKLQWSIAETDRALTAFIPQSAPFDENAANLAKRPLKTALIYVAHLKALDEKFRLGAHNRVRLLSLWSDIGSTGQQPLYSQLFLTPSVLKSGEVEAIVGGNVRRFSVFDDPLGRFLSPAELTRMADQVRYEVRLPSVKEPDKIDAAPFAAESRVGLRYDALAETQYLTYVGVLTDGEKARIGGISPSEVLTKLLNAVQVKAKEFTLIKGHTLALQGALGLTADEIAHILADSQQSLETAELSLANVSLLYRYAVLAKGLRLSVRELIILKQLAGLDPYKRIHADPLASIEEDHPFSQTLRFVHAFRMVQDSGVQIEDLDYFLRHRFDKTGKYRLDADATLGLLKTLAEGIRAVRIDHSIPDDPATLTEETLRQKLSLVFAANVVEFFLAMMNGTAQFTVARAVPAADQLNHSDFAGEPVISQLTYNATKQEQKLVFRGVLSDARKAELKATFNPRLNPAQQSVFATLLDAVQTQTTEQADAFFIKHLKKQPLIPTVTAGFIEASDFDVLFAAAANEEQRKKKLTVLANAFFPFLQQRMIRQFVVQTLTAYTEGEPLLVESLVTDDRLLKGTDSKPLIAILEATGGRGVTASFFNSDNLSGAPQAATPVVSSADTALKDRHDANGVALSAAGSARFEGYLQVRSPGAYRFFIELEKQDAEAVLRLDHLPDPVFLNGVAAANNATLGNQPAEFVELKPGVPYRFTFEVKKLAGGQARLLVQGETIPKDHLSQLTLYPMTAMSAAESAVLLLTKALQLIQMLGLSEREIRYIVKHPTDFGGIALSELPTDPSGDTPAEKQAATQRFNRFLRLAAYMRLKRDMVGDTDGLIDVLEAAQTGDTDKAEEILARLTRRDELAIKITSKLLTLPALTSEAPLERLWEALQVTERFGVPVTSLSDWIRIVSPAASAEERFRIARDVKEAIKSRFEPETWRRVAQPIFDKLRQRQRDALAAHVMHQHRFDRMEQLFEFFLIDSGVEPVVQTSRIRTAIAAVQIFIHRCLLNLEPLVAPSAINTKQWQWMKRYPVWTGNRKLWLYPENVLEPEFRDDKTHLFTELEGKLLQGDVTNDLVEDAFFNYLKKLDELARLDIVAMYCEEQPLDPASNQLHVIGRTFPEAHKYFYRRYAHRMWTPWEPLPVEIEGNHIVPVVWRDRLNLFWVTFIDRSDPDAGLADDTPFVLMDPGVSVLAKQETAFGNISASISAKKDPPKKVTEMTLGQLAGGVRSAALRKLVDVQLHWSEYFQGEWSVRESGGYSASLTKSVSFGFDRSKVFIHATKEFENGEEGGVKIHLGGEIDLAFHVMSRNSRPSIITREAPPNIPYPKSEVQANRYAGNGALKVTFTQRIETEVGKGTKTSQATEDILGEGTRFTVIPCANSITLASQEIASLVSPIFYQDGRANTFYVEPAFKEKTIEEWQEWVTRTPVPEVEWDDLKWWDKLPLQPALPKPKIPIPINPGDPMWRMPLDPRARFGIVKKEDWLTNPATVMNFEGELIGPAGHAGLAIQPDEAVAGGAFEVARPVVNINAGSAVPPDGTVVALDSNALASAGLTTAASGLNVIGSSGLNSALLKNVNKLKGI
jgi:Neuraminidase-like domain